MLGITESARTLILEAGAVTAALAVIVGSIAALLRFTAKRFTNAVRDQVGDALEEIRDNTAQLKPNGGTHLADAINRLENRQMQIKKQTDRLTKVLSAHLRYHEELDRDV